MLNPDSPESLARLHGTLPGVAQEAAAWIVEHPPQAQVTVLTLKAGGIINCPTLTVEIASGLCQTRA